MPVGASIDVKGSRLPRVGGGSSAATVHSGKSPVDSSPKSPSKASSSGAGLHKKMSFSSLGHSYAGKFYDEPPKSPSPSGFLLSSALAPPSAIRTRKSTSSLRNVATTSRPPLSPSLPGRFTSPAPIKRV